MAVMLVDGVEMWPPWTSLAAMAVLLVDGVEIGPP